jgi:hypothetical protein
VQPGCIGGLGVGNCQDDGLNGREPEREITGKMFD